jgi:hypothetical protein
MTKYAIPWKTRYRSCSRYAPIIYIFMERKKDIRNICLKYATFVRAIKSNEKLLSKLIKICKLKRPMINNGSKIYCCLPKSAKVIKNTVKKCRIWGCMMYDRRVWWLLFITSSSQPRTQAKGYNYSGLTCDSCRNLSHPIYPQEYWKSMIYLEIRKMSVIPCLMSIWIFFFVSFLFDWQQFLLLFINFFFKILELKIQESLLSLVI